MFLVRSAISNMVIYLQVIPVGHMTHTCQDDLVVKLDIEDVPYFNAPIYLENKEQIGKIDEIFGSIKDHYVSVNLGENFKAKSFTANQKVSFSSVLDQLGCAQTRGLLSVL